jgi:hypothetical protein
MLEANMDAYLGELLQSPELLSERVVENMIKGKFEDTKSLSIAAFRLSQNMNSFRVDFEGITSTWGLGINQYLDAVFHAQIFDRTEVYKHYLQHTLVDTVLLPNVDVVFAEAYWTGVNSSGHRGTTLSEDLPYLDHQFWFPGKVHKRISLVQKGGERAEKEGGSKKIKERRWRIGAHIGSSSDYAYLPMLFLHCRMK